MADSDKNILITPNRGSTTDLPKIEFTGADPNTITLSVLDDATLSFSGTSGQLFSISDSLTGTIFSVNDVSGIPSIEVDDDGTVRLAEFAGNLLVGTDVDAGDHKVQIKSDVYNHPLHITSAFGDKIKLTSTHDSIQSNTIDFYANDKNTGSIRSSWSSNFKEVSLGVSFDTDGNTQGRRLYIPMTGNPYFRYGATSDYTIWHSGIFANNSANWNTAYTYSQVGHLPLSGGELTGKIKIQSGDVATRKIVLWDGSFDNDYQFYGFGIETSTLLQSIPASTDFFRWFRGDTATTRTQLMELDGSGNLTVGSSANASTIIVNDIDGAKYQIRTGGYDLKFEKHDADADAYATALELRGVNANDGAPTVYVNNRLDLNGNIKFDGTATTINQSRGIEWTGFDKEGTTDFSDNAYIKHVTNVGGLSGSVLEIKSMNDASDGVAFTTNSNTGVRINGNTVFNDAYHPNADKWTTASTLSLTGDVTGSVSWDGSASASITATVANDSHTHDGRYYTESESDSRFVNVTGDTMTGNLILSGAGNAARLTVGGSRIISVSGSSDVVWQNLNQLRFSDRAEYDWNDWAGIKYSSANQIMTIGGPASGTFSSNTSPPSINIDFSGVNDIRHNGTTFLNTSRSLINIAGMDMSDTAIRGDSTFQFLTTGNGAQYGKFHGLSVSNSYSIGSYGGYFNALNGFMVNNTTVIDSSRNISGVNLDLSGRASVWTNTDAALVLRQGQSGHPWNYIEFRNSTNERNWYAGTDASGNYVMQGETGSTGVYTNKRLTAEALTSKAVTYVDSDHGSTRLQLKYRHGGVEDHIYSGHLTLWTSEPGITYDNCGIGGNVNVGGQHYGRQINSNSYGVYLRFDVNDGYSEFWSTTGNAGIAGGKGGRVWYVDATGDTYQTGDLNLTGSIYINNTSTRILEGSGNSVKVQTGTGYLELGSQNTGYCHLQSDRDFYFNRQIVVDTGYINSYNEDLVLRRASSDGHKMTLSTSGATFTGNVTAYSDRRLKDNIKTLDGSKVYEMRGVSFTKDGAQGSGVIAQELEQVAPELVLTNDDEMQTKSVAYGNVVGYLIEAIKEQKFIVDEQQKQIENLTNLVNQLLEK